MADTSVTGNISEPQLSYTQNGKATLKFSLAEDHSRFDKQANEYKQIGTTWYRVTLWEEFAESAAEYLHKGDRVIMEGRTETRAYITQDGTEGSSFDFHVKNIGKAIPKRAPQSQQQPQAQQSQPDAWGQPQPAQGGWDTPQGQGVAWDSNPGGKPPF